VSVLAVERNEHPVGWVTAAPLWSTLLADDPTADELDRMQRPALLRLDSDNFMDDLAKLLATDPAGVGDLEATPKSYRTAPPGADADYEPPIDHVKLYQAAHGHFNLVAATLVCRSAGLPDRAVDAATKESASFVLRRVSATGELAWAGKTWTPATPDALADGEELVPMFPMQYTAGDRTRRLFVGLLPTSSVESFKSGGTVSLSPQPGDRKGDPPDRRLEEIDEKIVSALKAITEAPSAPVDASRFLLLDLGDFLLRNAPQLWSAIQARQEPTAGDLKAAYDLLRDRWADTTTTDSWLDALLAVWNERDRIWGDADTPPAYEVDLAGTNMSCDELQAALGNALPERTAEQKKEPQPPFESPKLDPRPTTRYVVRCVYRRPACGPLHPDLLSDPSEQFAIATFFDLDAPARPVHVSLPLDTTIAGLRKAKKNVTFLISNQLRAQMDRVKDGKAALKGDMGPDAEIDLGFLCSFSIPIITICALIVLMIFISLLNIIFWWLPFLRICFPIPVKAKG
jgi:hypothetical protein